MTVVGIAASVGDNPAAWTIPLGLPVITTGKEETTYQMVYRLSHADTVSEINSAANMISARLPVGAVLDSSNYLDAKLNADRTTAVMIPFLLAFSGFALLASALIIANLVSGAVIAGIRDIGVMKSLGYTPFQVVLVFAGQMLIPSAIGCLIGVAAGIGASQPFLADTAQAFNLPQTFGVAPVADALGIAGILLLVITSTLLASWRAGRLHAAAAIATGSAPSSAGGYRLARMLARFPLPRQLTLGAGESVARPVRSAMTVGAVVIGVATITFALGLTRSLSDVKAGISRDQQVQVTVYRRGDAGAGKGGPVENVISDPQLTAMIAANPGTARFVPEHESDVTVSGVSHPVPLTGYRGDASWIGYPIISGRWLRAPGEAVAPTAFFTTTHHHVGDRITVGLSGQPITMTLVGEIFDVQDNGVLLRTDYSSFPANLEPNEYEIQVRPGTDPNSYAASFGQAGRGIDVQTTADGGNDTAFLLINSVLAGQGLILTLIALAGVFNTVVLNTREKARDLAILKALGMAPRQVVQLVLTSVVLLGALAAVIGIPAGMLLHRNILIVMGQIASSTNIPNQYFAVFDPMVLIGLAASAIGIAILGALVPGQWAARSGISQVLQIE
jgi:putative ABC transport system permease protein